MAPTPQEFADALRASEPSPIELAMLQWHYKAPHRVLTAARMSKLMGWSGQSANAQYGKFAGRVAGHLAWEPNDEDRYWASMKVSCLVIGERTTDDYRWTLRPEVAAAMEELGIAPLDVDVTAARLSEGDLEASSLSAKGRRVWIKSFWGFGTQNESYLGFSREGDRRRFIDLYRPGDLVLIYGAVAAETDADDRRQALGFLEVDPLPVSDKDRSSPEALEDKINRGWGDRWVHAVPVRRAWQIKRRIEIKYVAPTTYKYERARAIATQGELLTEAEATFALSLPVSPLNVYLERPVTDTDLEASLDDLLNPSRGIRPSFGTKTTTTIDGEHFLYLMEMVGDISSVLGRDRLALVKKSLVKVGYSNDPERRWREMNSGLPPAGKLQWRMALRSQAFKSADAAFEAENQAKADLARSGESLGGEFFIGTTEKIHAAFHTSAGRAAFVLIAPPSKPR